MYSDNVTWNEKYLSSETTMIVNLHNAHIVFEQAHHYKTQTLCCAPLKLTTEKHTSG